MQKFIQKTIKSVQDFFHSFTSGKRKISHNFIIVMVGIIALIIIGFFVYFNQPSDIDKLNTTYIDTIEEKKPIEENVKNQYDDSYLLSDYTIYGEDLALYHDIYGNNADDLLGKNIVLRNIETGDELTYTMSGAADSGIQLKDLSDGIYEIYVYDHYIKKRVYFNEPVTSDTFYTIRRDEKVKNIGLNASKDYLKRFNITSDKNYAYLTVTSQIPKVKVVDIIIDPSGNVYNDSTNSLDTGMGNTKIMETESSMELAELVKKELEKAGLRVNMTRDDTSTPGYYGTDSRVGKGYDSAAKVFLNLSMLNDENERYDRPYMMVSPLTNSNLANQISYRMQQEGLELTHAVAEEALETGVVFDSYAQNEDGTYTHFTQYPQLRETGGKATFTGESDISTANQIYADDYGMEAVMFRYCNLANNSSIDYYLENKEKIAKAIAKGILDYYDIEVEISETAN